MKIAMYALPWPTPKMIEGEHASLKLPALLKEKGIQRVLLVSDPTIVKLGLLEAFLNEAKKENVDVQLFYEIEANPIDTNVEAGFLKYKESKAEALVLFGGGAAIDCGKAIGAKVAHPNKEVKKLQGLFKVLKKTPLTFAIPTTAGTGSETTIAAVITEEKTITKQPSMIYSLCQTMPF